jgi:AraC-like DNA-binding protein
MEIMPRPRFISPEVWRRALYFSHTRKALQYLEEHRGEAIGSSEVAAAACMGRTAFSRAFRRVTGIRFRDFVWAYRVSAAAELILTRDRSLTDLAFEVGFGSVVGFERAFKRVAGSTPAAFRRELLRSPSPPPKAPTEEKLSTDDDKQATTE